MLCPGCVSRQLGAWGTLVDVGILGEFQARLGPDDPWSPAASQQVGKLGCVLAAWPQQVVEHATLIQALWGAEPPRTAANTLQAHVSRLRRVLGAVDAIQRRSRGYLIDVPRENVDAEKFQELISSASASCQAGDYGEGEGMLIAALALWRGTPFLDIQEPELIARRARLEELRALARENLVLCRIRLAEDPFQRDCAVAEARELVTLAPDRSKGHLLLAEALEGAGRDSEAQQIRMARTSL